MKLALLITLGLLSIAVIQAREERSLYEEDDDSFYDKQKINAGAKSEKKFPPVYPHAFILLIGSSCFVT